jgi:hypothetical protein
MPLAPAEMAALPHVEADLHYVAATDTPAAQLCL